MYFIGKSSLAQYAEVDDSESERFAFSPKMSQMNEYDNSTPIIEFTNSAIKQHSINIKRYSNNLTTFRPECKFNSNHNS